VSPGDGLTAARKFAVVFIWKLVPGQLTEDARRFF
jgi:hypothetical protein